MQFLYSRILGNDPTKGPKMFEHEAAPKKEKKEKAAVDGKVKQE